MRAEAAAAVGGGGFSEIFAQDFQDFVAVFYFGELAGDVFAKSDDLSDGLAVFALEAVEEGEAVFNLGQALGAGIDALGVVAQAGGDIADEWRGRRLVAGQTR